MPYIWCGLLVRTSMYSRSWPGGINDCRRVAERAYDTVPLDDFRLPGYSLQIPGTHGGFRKLWRTPPKGLCRAAPPRGRAETLPHRLPIDLDNLTDLYRSPLSYVAPPRSIKIALVL